MRMVSALFLHTTLNSPQTNRRNHELVKDSTEIQYRLLLQTSGHVDGIPGIPIADKLLLLRAHERRLRSMNFGTSQQYSLVDPPGKCIDSAFSDGVFAHVYYSDGTGQSTIVLDYLPTFLDRSHPTGTRPSSKLVYDFLLNTFILDGSHDLLIVVRKVGG